LYLGKEYTLRIAKGVLPEGVNLEENYIVVAADETKVSVNGPQYIRNVLKNFYVNQFVDIAKTRMDFFSPKIGVCPRK